MYRSCLCNNFCFQLHKECLVQQMYEFILFHDTLLLCCDFFNGHKNYKFCHLWNVVLFLLKKFYCARNLQTNYWNYKWIKEGIWCQLIKRVHDEKQNGCFFVMDDWLKLMKKTLENKILTIFEMHKTIPILWWSLTLFLFKSNETFNLPTATAGYILH